MEELLNSLKVKLFNCTIEDEVNKNTVSNLKSIKFRKHKKVVFNNKEIEVLKFS